jgi:N-acetyltransferase
MEIGYIWYVKSYQCTHVNTTVKLLLMTHAFEALSGHALHRDGTIRDTVMYSMRASEWPEARAQLLYLLDKPQP